MSEWVSVLAVFWALWALDGLRAGPRHGFTLTGWRGGRGGRRREARARVTYARLSLPGWWAAGWRVPAADVPVALSPEGFCTRVAGAAGRPAEQPEAVRAWRWSEVREVGLARGWVYVNGAPAYPNTGHVPAPELLRLAQLAPGARAARLAVVMARWFRPAHLRRRLTVLLARTRLAAALNAASFAGFAAVTVYVAGDIAARLPERWSTRAVWALIGLLAALFIAHFVALVVAWRAARRLKPVTTQKRGANLLSALLMPPQALRLRALAGEGFFPAQHPLAAILALAPPREREAAAFAVVADLRWPVDEHDDPALAREIVPWFRTALAPLVQRSLAGAGLAEATLLAVPTPDAPASTRYCPRCRAQFVDGRTVCPNGVTLAPVGRAKP